MAWLLLSCCWGSLKRTAALLCQICPHLYLETRADITLEWNLLHKILKKCQIFKLKANRRFVCFSMHFIPYFYFLFCVSMLIRYLEPSLGFPIYRLKSATVSLLLFFTWKRKEAKQCFASFSHHETKQNSFLHFHSWASLLLKVTSVKR